MPIKVKFAYRLQYGKACLNPTKIEKKLNYKVCYFIFCDQIYKLYKCYNIY
jgi:hypothetical protein